MAQLTVRDAAWLARLLAQHALTPAADRPFAIVDVRDSDHAGGHIPGSIHVPSTTFARNVGWLVQQLQGKDEVVFHCMMSQQRGPACARVFARELQKARSDETAAVTEPVVSVLTGGFANWVSIYRRQAATLIADYDPKVWS